MWQIQVRRFLLRVRVMLGLGNRKSVLPHVLFLSLFSMTILGLLLFVADRKHQVEHEDFVASSSSPTDGLKEKLAPKIGHPQEHHIWKLDEIVERLNLSHSKGWNVVTKVALNEREKEKRARIDEETEKEYQGTTLEQKRDAIKEALAHSFRGYMEKAWGHDEIRPTTNQTNDSWGHFGATILDSLDSLYLMGLKTEFERGVAHVSTLNFESDVQVSMFETTIRLLGGLLGAYDLSKEKILLDKAIELGDRLLFAFDTKRLPHSVVNLKTGQSHNYAWTNGASILAEFGSVQLEMKHLSALSGDPKYGVAAQAVMEKIEKMQRQDGLFDVLFDPFSLRSVAGKGKISFGGLGDSFYEYLLKQWLLSRRTETTNMELFLAAMQGLVEDLVFQSRPSYLTYVSELMLGRPTHVMEHLACFVPGMLALGAHSMEGGGWEGEGVEELAERHSLLAKLILDTCVYIGESSPSGLPPDSVKFWTAGGGGASDFQVVDPQYLLRPETVESLFYLYRFTHDESYRKHGWRLFNAIQRNCRTDAAYSGVKDVRKTEVEKNNSMQSFFLAETLKYFYLLFSDDDVLSLDSFVLTTEGHPLRIHTLEQMNWKK